MDLSIVKPRWAKNIIELARWCNLLVTNDTKGLAIGYNFTIGL